MISEKIEAIKTAVMEELAKSEHLQDIQDIRVKFLGKKGELTAIMKEMKTFPKKIVRKSASWSIRHAVPLKSS